MILRTLLALGCSSWLSVASPAALTRTPDEGDDEYRFLVGLVEKGMLEMAVDEAQSFLRERPRHARAPMVRYRLATALFDLGRGPEATPHFAALSRRDGFEYRAEALFRLGQCELDASRLEEAEGALNEALRAGQAYLVGPTVFLLGETAFRGRRYEKAERRYSELLEDHPSSEYVADAERALGWCAWELGNARRALQRVRGYLNRHEGAQSDDEMRVLLGEILLELERPDEALEAYRSVSGGEFADAALRGSGFALAAKGEHRAAASEFERLTQRHPKSRYAGEAALHRGIELLLAGEAEAASSALRELSAEQARDPEALYWTARALKEAGQMRAALQKLEQALALEPEAALEARLQVARGELLSSMGRTEDALSAFERAGSDYALYAAAVAGLNEKDTANAIRLATNLIEEHPHSPYLDRARLARAEALFHEGRLAEAEQGFEELVSSEDPELSRSRVLSRLGWCRYLQSDPAGAARHFDALLESCPEAEEREESLYMLGRALADAGRTRRATEVRASYLRAWPQGEHVAEVLLASGLAGEGEEGRSPLERLVEEHTQSALVPKALSKLGDLLLEAGEPAAALRRYQELLERFEDSELRAQARYGCAWCLYELQRFDECGAELARLEDQSTLEAELQTAAFELAVWTWCRAGRTQRAAQAWRSLARSGAQDERSFRAARMVVQTMKEAGDLAPAQALLDELLTSLHEGEVAIAALIEGTYLALDGGQLDRAMAQLRVASRQASGSPEVREASFYVGEALFERGRDEHAIELYRTAASDRTLGAQALYKLGFALLRNADPARAAGAFTRLVNEHPEHELVGEALFLLGESHFRQEQWREATLALERLRSACPEHQVMPKALFRLGIALAELERWADAADALSDLARRYPEFENRIEGELWRGKALAARGKHTAARQAFERVIAGDRGELAAEARLGLGALHESRDLLEEALSEYLKVALLYAHDAKVAEALYRAGSCLERLGDLDKASRQYRELLDEHEDSPFAERARERLRALRSQ